MMVKGPIDLKEMCLLVCGQASGEPASGAFVRCGIGTLDGPSALITGDLVLVSSRPRLHNVPRHAMHGPAPCKFRRSSLICNLRRALKRIFIDLVL